MGAEAPEGELFVAVSGVSFVVFVRVDILDRPIGILIVGKVAVFRRGVGSVMDVAIFLLGTCSSARFYDAVNGFFDVDFSGVSVFATHENPSLMYYTLGYCDNYT